MLNYGKNKEMQKRPEQEPKFSLKNKTDKYIFIFVICSLAIIAALIAVLVCAFVLK